MLGPQTVSLPETGRAQGYVGFWRGTSWPTLLPTAYLRVHLFLLAAVRWQKCVSGDCRWLFLEPCLKDITLFLNQPVYQRPVMVEVAPLPNGDCAAVSESTVFRKR